MCRLEVDLGFVALARHSGPDFHRDKLQQESTAFWIPGRVSLARNNNSDASFSYAHGRLFSVFNVRSYVRKPNRPFRKVCFASRRRVSTIPEGGTKLGLQFCR